MKKNIKAKRKERKKASRLKKKIISALLAFLIVPFAWYLMQRYDAWRDAQKNESKTYRLSGRLDNGRADPHKVFNIRIGQVIFLTTYGEISGGLNLRERFNIGYDYPITIKFDNNGNLLVSASFNDKSGKLIADIVENEWRVNRGDFYDRNFSLNTLEVVDDKKMPVLQVGISDGNNIFINGTFYFPGKVWFAAENESFISGDPKFINATPRKLKRIFKYPGNDYMGVKEGRLALSGLK